MRGSSPLPAIVAVRVRLARPYPVRVLTNFGLLFEAFPLEARGVLISPCCRTVLFSPEGFNARGSLCRGCLKAHPTPASLVELFKAGPLSAATFAAVCEQYLDPLSSVVAAGRLHELLQAGQAVPHPGINLLPRARYAKRLRRLMVGPLFPLSNPPER